MAIILPRQLPPATEVFPDAQLIVDTGTAVERATPQQIVDASTILAVDVDMAGGQTVEEVVATAAEDASEARAVTDAMTPFGRSLTDDVDAAAARQTLDVVHTAGSYDNTTGRVVRLSSNGYMGIGNITALLADASVVNNTIVPGWYHISNTTTGVPTGVNFGFMQHSRRATGGGEVQILIVQDPVSRAGEIQTRARGSGAWSAWRKNSGDADFTSRAELVTWIASGATYAAGREIRADGLSYVWSQGATSIPDLPNVLPLGVSTAEHYGCVGNGTTDERDKLRAWLSGPVRVFGSRKGAVYHTTGQLDFGRSSEWRTNVQFRVTGSRTAAGASLNVQTGGGDQHLNALYVEGEHLFQELVVDTVPAATNPWLALVGNDFYARQNGERPAYPTRLKATSLVLRSSAWLTGATGDGNSAIRLQGMDKCDISFIEFQNIDQTINFKDVTEVYLGEKGILFQGCGKGVGILRSRWVETGNIHFYGRTTDKLSLEQPGYNAAVIRACIYACLGDVIAEDTGEHGIRLTGGVATPGAGGIWGIDVPGDYSFGDVKIYRPGASGVKVDSGGGVNPINGADFGSIYVEDAGTARFSPGMTPAFGDNHFGLNIQNVRRFTCKSYQTRKKTNTYNGTHFGLFRQVTWLIIGDIQAEGCYSSGLFWNQGEETTGYNFNIGGGFLSEFGADNNAALHFNAPANTGRVSIDVDVTNGPKLFLFSGGGFATQPANLWKITTTVFNVTDITATGIPARVRLDVRQATPPTNSGSTDFGSGDTLAAAFTGTALRNALIDVYLDTATTSAFLAAPAGAAAPTGAGTKLPGVWRARGAMTISGSIIVNAVKISP